MDFDYSKVPTDELLRIYHGMKRVPERLSNPQSDGPSNSAPEQQQEEGLASSLGHGYLNYAGGALRGMGQAAGDFGASVANWPISGIEKLTGKQIPHVPHPHLLNENPGSLSESVGQVLGQIGGGLALPGGAAVKSAQLANKGYQAFKAGKQLPLIAQIAAGMGGGALEGAAGYEENRPLGAAIGSIVGGGAAGVSGATSKILARNGGERAGNVYNIKDLEKNKDAALRSHEEQQQLVDMLKKQYAEQHAGFETPGGIQRAINKKQGVMDLLEPSANVEEKPTENLLPWATGDQALSSAQKQKKDVLREKTDYLTSSQPKGVEFAEKFQEMAKQGKKHIQENNYKPAEEYTKNNYITLPNTETTKKLENELRSFFEGKFTVNEPQFQRALEQYKKNNSPKVSSTTHDLIPAHEYIQNWKDTKSVAAKARSLAFKEGGENRGHWMSEATKLQGIADKQLAVLGEHIPQHIFQKMTEGDKLWKEHIVPLYGNKIYEQSKPKANKGRIDVSDIMHEIRANEPGQSKVREMILSNPTLSKLALGHKYAEKPEGLLSASPYEQQFIDKVPSLKGMVERHHQANRNIDIANAHKQWFKERQQQVDKGYGEILEQQTRRKNAIAERSKLGNEVSDFKSKKEALKQQLQKASSAKKAADKAAGTYTKAVEDKKTLKGAAQFGLSLMGANQILKWLR